jgi:cytochrome c oxidase subunit 1
VTRNTYNELFTIHGTTMIFLFIVPFWAGLANYLVPLMIGARDMAFPRLNALSYWLFLFGGLTMFMSFLASGGASKSGWYGYPPLSEKFFSPGNGQDLWILSLHLVALSSLVGAINFLCTIHNMRAPGMSWMRIPLFVWTIEIYSVLLLAVIPVISVALTFLLLDRQAGTHFFLPDQGGSALLYQHLFWFFGHPEVYIIILPGMGVISEVIPVFSRKPIFGYKAVAFSTVAIGFYSMLGVGAPHVQRRAAELPQRLLHALVDGDRRARRA